MRTRNVLGGLAMVVLVLTFVVSGTSSSNADVTRSFTLCNYATRGAVWARFISYHTSRASWMSSGYVYIAQGRCANFDHDGNQVYYYATNQTGQSLVGR